jgi:uncharacterized protein YdeI (YjbR/CyaY-like superfamily)
VLPKTLEMLSFVSRGDWRRWLTKNHQRKEEIWLVYDKKVFRKQLFSYRDFLADVVEEAICFGWIDSRVKRIGESKLAIRLTPRRSPDNWSKYNKARVLEMIKKKRMTRAGLEVLPAELRVKHGLRKRVSRQD